ncbi:simple sugar transport system ATP-binding protein [Paracoccus isoporae]|uniref:Simple sugar transport system ATP-binding protein n=1 Tax=Paracoccus isoporae TaxID=591205 RepID=A0A1G7DM27_9RHOB|nr:sugar ABC transporter ATP-binding protein [Paracoccus isoporae]SDE52558.1 simple sugar transport system ATP-binding protein [Paracoccus isoporae]
MPANAIAIAGLTKSFARNRVLRGIDLTLPAGQVTVLMGANGAGKSTLVKILCGVFRPDGGSVMLGGRPFAPAAPVDALRAGVVTVHQNINEGVAPDLDVASNLLLDDLASGSGFFLNRRRMREEGRRIADAVGLDVAMGREVASLSLADRQLVSIARAMAHRPRLMILDEPTSSLSAAETERLFALIEQLKAEGVAILYISHRMSDIRRLADRIVSMRDGQISGTFEGRDLDYAGAVRAMLGHEITEVDIRIPDAGGAVIEAAGMRLREGARPFDLTLRENEVVAVAGLVGSGKSALAEALFGVSAPVSGEMSLDGKPFRPKSPGDAVRQGVFHLSKDRLRNAVIPDFDIARNITLPFLSRHQGALSIMRRGSERATAARMIDMMGVVCQGPRDEILTLSGGNQQKVVVARWLAEPCRLLILDEPFQGVDIEARRDIGRRIRDSAADRATLVLCAEIDEALEIADRILVMSEHSIAGAHRNAEIDLDLLMAQVTDTAPPPSGGAQLGVGT